MLLYNITNLNALRHNADDMTADQEEEVRREDEEGGSEGPVGSRRRKQLDAQSMPRSRQKKKATTIIPLVAAASQDNRPGPKTTIRIQQDDIPDLVPTQLAEQVEAAIEFNLLMPEFDPPQVAIDLPSQEIPLTLAETINPDEFPATIETMMPPTLTDHSTTSTEPMDLVTSALVHHADLATSSFTELPVPEIAQSETTPTFLSSALQTEVTANPVANDAPAIQMTDPDTAPGASAITFPIRSISTPQTELTLIIPSAVPDAIKNQDVRTEIATAPPTTPEQKVNKVRITTPLPEKISNTSAIQQNPPSAEGVITIVTDLPQTETIKPSIVSSDAMPDKITPRKWSALTSVSSSSNTVQAPLKRPASTVQTVTAAVSDLTAQKPAIKESIAAPEKQSENSNTNTTPVPAPIAADTSTVTNHDKPDPEKISLDDTAEPETSAPHEKYDAAQIITEPSPALHETARETEIEQAFSENHGDTCDCPFCQAATAAEAKTDIEEKFSENHGDACDCDFCKQQKAAKAEPMRVDFEELEF